MPCEDISKALRDQARNHHIRRGILALVAGDRGRSLAAADLQRDLPEHPSIPVIEYHLLVLRQADLLPPQETG